MCVPAVQEDVEKRFQFGMQYLMKKGHMGETSPVIGVQGVAPGQGSTGMMKVHAPSRGVFPSQENPLFVECLVMMLVCLREVVRM